jgi:acyl carrier protein
MGSVTAIEENLLAKLAKKFGTEPELSDGLAYVGVDSIGLAELTAELEVEYGIRVSDDVVALETVQELADYIQQRCDASAGDSK